MTALYVLLATVALLAFGIWLAVRSARKEGAAVEREATARKVLDDAATIRRLRDDPAFLERLRQKYRE